MFKRIELLSRARTYEVWDGWDTERGCRVILKSVREDRRHDRRARDRLLAEGRLLESLRHPHIVRALETLERPEPLVVMETIGGATLSHMIDEDEPLAAAEIAHLGLHLVSAVNYLHRAGYLHLDLKPSNVIGDAGRAKLIDLGLAAPPGRVSPGRGTWSYLAPEQVDGEQVSAAADVWGLGAVMFDCVCGFAPFDDPGFVPVGATSGRGPSDSRWRFKGEYGQLHRRARPVAEIRPIDSDLADLIADCLEPDPELRPGLARVAARLEPITGTPEGEPLLSAAIAGAR